jgi:hypothetical protein
MASVLSVGRTYVCFALVAGSARGLHLAPHPRHPSGQLDIEPIPFKDDQTNLITGFIETE